MERLKIAVEKARAMRATAAHQPPGTDFLMREKPAPEPADRPETTGEGPAPGAWEALEPVELDARHLERHRVITYDRQNPAHVAFDVLRTRILRAFQKFGWTRVGITSPGKGCGKTFVATNLALSLSRQPDCRTILMDVDLRAPAIAKVLGVRDPDPASWFLNGDVPAQEYLRRVGSNLALGLNSKRVPDAAELLLAPGTGRVLDSMRKTFAPDVVIYDLPPMLTCDDVLGFLPQLDCVLLVVGGGQTQPQQVSECERLLADQTHLLGVLLNRAEGADPAQYGYGYEQSGPGRR